jgi:hypothetical protein
MVQNGMFTNVFGWIVTQGNTIINTTQYFVGRITQK